MDLAAFCGIDPIIEVLTGGAGQKKAIREKKKGWKAEKKRAEIKWKMLVRRKVFGTD